RPHCERSAAARRVGDILGHGEHKDTEKNTLRVARSTRRRRAAGEACQPQTNDHWTVARSFVCGWRASRLGLRCRPSASSASVSHVSVACPNQYVGDDKLQLSCAINATRFREDIAIVTRCIPRVLLPAVRLHCTLAVPAA